MSSKITPTPWVAGGFFPYKGNEGYIFGVTTRPEVLVCKTFGSIDENTPPLDEQFENSKAIVAAVNGTYGQGIDPSAVKEMYEALVAIVELHNLGGLAEMVELGTKDVFSHAKIVLQMCRISIEKAKI